MAPRPEQTHHLLNASEELETSAKTDLHTDFNLARWVGNAAHDICAYVL